MMKKYGLLIASFVAVVIFFILPLCINKGVVIVDNGQTNYVIVVGERADENVKFAASELQRYIERITNVKMPIVTDTTTEQDSEIVIGTTNRQSGVNTDTFGRDGFNIKIDDNKLFISSHEGIGAMYGVYTLLDEYFGVRLYSASVEIIPESKTMVLPKNINNTQIPIITFRDVFYTPTNDNHYINFHRLNHDDKGQKPDWGLWVHTFTHLVPPKIHLAKHPEYYSLVAGRRTPQQLCLSNPEVLEILCENLKNEMNAKPTAKYWSVSSDDNFSYCQCDECKKLDDIDGSPTGSVIQFVNKVAERFPDKIISTLAYQYSRAAPKVTKPANNVNIMFCNIECNRSMAIATDPTSESFRKDMEDWAKLTDNIVVWDYIIQFKNLVSPFPNFHTLQSNVQYFVDNSVVAMFEQGNREVGGEFADMRSYITSKLMWNPYANVDSLMTDFCNGYYGKGGVFVKEYINLITKNLIDSGDQMSIFGSPNDAYKSYLSYEKLSDYQAIFNKAEEATKDNKEVLRRVKIARQPLYYTELERVKLDPYGKNGVFIKDSTNKWITDPRYITKLDDFVALCNDEGVTRLSEWHTTPDEYHKMMRDMAILRSDGSLSFEKKVTFSPIPSPTYAKTLDKILTNGIYGTGDHTIQWLGWDVPKFSVVIDLEKTENIKLFSSRFMQNSSQWIFLPKEVVYSVSEDGVNFTNQGGVKYSITDKLIDTHKYELKKECKARYIKIDVIAQGVCPSWHAGSGEVSWAFCDEISIE